jgi:hypothetical protein
MGGGICAMHYTGMAAMRMSPPIQYEPTLFVASVAVAVGASLAGPRGARACRDYLPRNCRSAAAAASMAATILEIAVSVMLIVALLFLLMGLAAFAMPRRFLERLDLRAETPTARNEVQAVYGGFGVAMAAVLVAPQWLPQLQAGIAFTVAAALAGMAAGRLLAALRERPGRWPLVFFGIEALGSALLFLSLPEGTLAAVS